MSKIGKQPVILPETAKVTVENGTVQIEGEKGKFILHVSDGIEVVKKDNQLLVNCLRNDRKTHALHGTIRQLLANAVAGVQKEWEKKLKVVGTGYSAVLKGEKLVLSVGFSHEVTITPLPGIHFEVEKDIITVKGIDKSLVGRQAAEIRAVRSPDAYKGKGIRYLEEEIKLKPGKAAKTGEGAAK